MVAGLVSQERARTVGKYSVARTTIENYWNRFNLGKIGSRNQKNVFIQTVAESREQL
jgi:hypothetical protein